MQTPKFPYDLSRIAITVRFNDISFLTDLPHHAWDIVPLYKRLDGLPADVYPVFSGQTIRINDTDVKLGKGIKVRTNLWPDIQKYLKTFGVEGDYIDILYWHMLHVTDKDGWVDQNTPVGITGNTGWVYSNGAQVPDNLKGVPPYPGLHLHLVTEVGGKAIDPDIIFNYKPMSQIKTQAVDNERRIVLAASSWDEWVALCKVYGVDPNQVDETVKIN